MKTKTDHKFGNTTVTPGKWTCGCLKCGWYAEFTDRLEMLNANQSHICK